jgi:hypothetical protein
MYNYIYTHTRIFTDVFLRAWCFSGLISVVMADPPWDIHMELLGKLRFPRLPMVGMETNTVNGDLWGCHRIDGDFIRFFIWGFHGDFNEF